MRAQHAAAPTPPSPHAAPVPAQHAAPRAASPLAVLALAGVCALLVALQPVEFLVRHLKDDSYYYFRTANHIALGHGATFDGIDRTNGFHPLWMLNLVPIYAALLTL